MFGSLFPAVLGVGAMLAAFGGCLAVISVVHFNRHRVSGWFHLSFYVIFFTVAVSTALSGRDLTNASWLVDSNLAQGNGALSQWIFRIASVFLLVVSVERIASSFFRSRGGRTSLPLLVVVFILFWIGTVAVPSNLSEHSQFFHEFTYTLLIGWAAVLLSQGESKSSMLAARNSVFILILVGFFVAPFKMGLVFETGYSQGYIPGLPRMAGLTPHALQLGLMAQVALLCLWVLPFKKSWVNWSAWIMGLLALILAQSKTAWLSFFLCAVVMLVVRNGFEIRRKLLDSERPLLGIFFVLFFMVLAVFASSTLFFGGTGEKIFRFFDSTEGSKLLTFNGRDQIWDVALNEWHRSPILGYGSTLFSADYRKSIGLLNATHAHNQFLDTLARAGIVGAFSLILYTGYLMILSFRFCKESEGLSIALFLILFIRGISEVPFSMYGYGGEFASHVLLLVVLVGAAHIRRINSFAATEHVGSVANLPAVQK